VYVNKEDYLVTNDVVVISFCRFSVFVFVFLYTNTDFVFVVILYFFWVHVRFKMPIVM